MANQSIARQVLLWQLALVLLLVAAGSGVALHAVHRSGAQTARERALDVARTLARSPGLAEAAGSADPTARLQPMAETVRRENKVDFVVVMSVEGIRYTHPDPTRIGKTFLGHIDGAARGRTTTETYTGTLGPSVRAVVPVFGGPDGRPVALVSVGVTNRRVDALVGAEIPLVLTVAAGALALACAASMAVHHRLRRQTLGLGPVELRRMYEHHDAVLHAVREGLAVVDADGRLVLANDEAVRLLALPADFEGRHVGTLDLDESLADTLAAGRTVADRIHLCGTSALAVNVSPTGRDGRMVATFRDHTELRALVGELDQVRGFADALRASAHEAGNRLHTVVALVELGRGEEAIRFATGELAAARDLADELTNAVSEPALAALLFGKHAQAAERGVQLTVTGGSAADGTTAVPLHAPAARFDPHDLVTVLGNLVDNAIDAAVSAPPPRTVRVTVGVDPDADGALLLRVADSGPGIDEPLTTRVFERGWSTKEAYGSQGRGLGLALVRATVARHAGSVEVARGPDGGAVFTVRLPAAVPRPRAEEDA
ncbi:sensor histidine kinase [Embleya hyalina]|uniref:histidine kinase n=1 Tax=Embleya hyalina TaxID=516124 RepID=A0A401YKA7_9ACTN|nr:sensor histidine kinase [Embleya hyalina]GCD95026.1 histidine kinase [Embleya hyalina]